MKTVNTPAGSIMKGIFWATVASTMFGISGTVLQFISQGQDIPASWFLSARTLGAGVVLLLISLVLYGKKTFAVFGSLREIAWLVAYAIIGLGANLLTFYMSVQTGNAAASTILQYLSPLFIVLGSFLFKHERPLRSDMVAFVVAMIGVFLAITRGNISQLAIPFDSLLWGIGSGITAACYVVLPRTLVRDDGHSPITVLGWGTLIAGIVFNLNHPVWVSTPPLTTGLLASMSTVILVGTILPFSLLLYSSHFAPSDVISIVDATQPVMTFILSILFLSLKITIAEVIGSVLVIVAIYLLQRGRRKVTTVFEEQED
ncbi:DMT family permease [Levilactobacillus acidifarinae DSM 19394]|uniref:DMT family permease n=2 Tax=Levilactobacillus acidifarinae TaxID=267364 RepID=A0A0R1LM13_9LACO|nr:DMT family permease [Levilactobacillus acidifarinae DSM 19394]GEO69748.1 membrane protein [Levilactobacillus acidifarinae]